MSKKISSSNPMVKVLDDGLMGIHETKCVLARAWRILLYETGLTAIQWHTLLNKWQAKVQKSSTEKEATNIKGNATRRLAKDIITWNGLMEGVYILEFTRVEVNLRLHKGSKVRELNLDVDLTNIDMHSSDDDT